MADYQLITINQLDIQAIADYVVAKEKLVYRSDASAGTAEDVDKVSGIPAERIAVAADILDRETVKNALNLGGRPAADYLLKTEGTELSTNLEGMKKIYKAEVEDLRDELYQLKNQLARGGFVRDDGQYMGFHDLFSSRKTVHEAELLGTGSTVGVGNNVIKANPEAYARIDQYDFIALKNANNGNIGVYQVSNKGTDGTSLTLDSAIDVTVTAAELEIYKSAGIIHAGAFKFAKPPTNTFGANEFYSGVSDDSFNIYRKMGTPREGFAYNFRIPEGKVGFLSDIELCLRAYGRPGDLMCYVIDERDIEKFKNPAQAELDYKNAMANGTPDAFHFFAKSRPFTLDASLGKQYCKISFEGADNTMPLIPVPKDGEVDRYVLIVELLSGDTNNYYNILFLQHKGPNGELGDLQLNNTAYVYTRQDDTSATPSCVATTEINKSDMFYQIHTIESVANEPVAMNAGLYSAIVYSNQKVDGRKARVTMRIKREGQFSVNISESPLAVPSGPVAVKNDKPGGALTVTDDLSLKGDLYKPLELRAGASDTTVTVPVVVGDNQTTVMGVTRDDVTFKNPVLLFKDDPVYRIGYWVAIKACRLNFDKTTGVMSKTEFKRFNLPLTNVVRDTFKESDEISDRLIFESDLKVTDCNYFEIQVYWGNQAMSSYPGVRNAQMGAIKEITLSLDRYF